MVPTAGAAIGLLPPVLLLLSDCAWAEHCAWACCDAASLCYTFTITRNGEPWYEVQGQVDGNPFLKYTSSSEAKLIGPLGMKANATKAWNDQTGTLKELMEVLKKKLLDINSEVTINRVSLSLQGSIVVQLEATRTIRGFLELGSDGQRFHRFDLENRNYIVDHCGDERMKENFENDKHLTMFLTKIPGHCKKWRDEFLEHWKEELSATAPPTMVPTTTPSKATSTKLISWILSVFLPCLMTIGILRGVIYS